MSRDLPTSWVPFTRDDLDISNFYRKFVEIEFDAIKCAMSQGFSVKDLGFEALRMEWIRRDFEPSHTSEEGDSGARE